MVTLALFPGLPCVPPVFAICTLLGLKTTFIFDRLQYANFQAFSASSFGLLAVSKLDNHKLGGREGLGMRVVYIYIYT